MKKFLNTLSWVLAYVLALLLALTVWVWFTYITV